MFQEDQLYTRNDIHAQVGGGIQDYLPHANGRVVAMCLREDTNPDAPTILLAGSGPDVYRWACVLCDQADVPVPTCIREKSHGWRYVGMYSAQSWTENPAEIAIHNQRANRDDIRRVIFLERSH